jgi:DnaJ-class molecular chaperone
MTPGKRQWCQRCDGTGSVWTFDFYDGFERNRRWETCERCQGDGFEPQEEPQEEEDDGQ